MGMTMTLGEFRERTKGLPDDTDIMVDEGNLIFFEIRVRWVLPPVLDHPHCVTLEMGQSWNHELDLDARVDAQIGL
jgi:hypothetical protein